MSRSSSHFCPGSSLGCLLVSCVPTCVFMLMSVSSVARLKSQHGLRADICLAPRDILTLASMGKWSLWILPKGSENTSWTMFFHLSGHKQKSSCAKSEGSHEAKSVGSRVVPGSLNVTCFEELCWNQVLETRSWFWKQKSRKKLRLSFSPPMKETPLPKRWGPRAASSCNLPCSLALKSPMMTKGPLVSTRAPSWLSSS